MDIPGPIRRTALKGAERCVYVFEAFPSVWMVVACTRVQVPNAYETREDLVSHSAVPRTIHSTPFANTTARKKFLVAYETTSGWNHWWNLSNHFEQWITLRLALLKLSAPDDQVITLICINIERENVSVFKYSWIFLVCFTFLIPAIKIG